MRLGEVERMCIQSSVGEDRTVGRGDSGRGKRRKRISIEHWKEGEKENEGVIKYPTAEVKSDRKNAPSAVLVTAYEFTFYPSSQPFLFPQIASSSK